MINILTYNIMAYLFNFYIIGIFVAAIMQYDLTHNKSKHIDSWSYVILSWYSVYIYWKDFYQDNK